MNSHPPFPPTVPTPLGARLSVIGVGGAGVRTVSRFTDASGRAHRFLVDPDVQVLAGFSQGNGVALGSQVTRGLGCGADAAYAQKLAEAEIGRLRELTPAGVVVLVAGAGGGTGAGMTPVLARSAREAGAFVIAVVIEPFQFEGGLRHLNAAHCVSTLQGVCDTVIRVSNQSVARLEPDVTGIGALMAKADSYVDRVLTGLLRLLQDSSLIPIGLAELERWARGRQSEGVAALASANGVDRVQLLWNQLENHPFLQPVARLHEAGGVLLHVVGGPDLRLDELELLQVELQRRCPAAQLLVGAGLDEAETGQIHALLIAVSHGVGLPPTPGSSTAPSARPAAGIHSRQLEDTGVSGNPSTLDVDLPAPSRDPRRGSFTSGGGTRRARQQVFDFVPRWTSRFDNTEATLHQGENLDEPTFVRRGVKLN